VIGLGAGEVLHGTYRIERLLHKSPRSELYVVAHTRLPRRFALKRLRLAAAQRADFCAHFAHQAERLCRLRHPHIVEVLDCNATSSGDPYLVMELLRGEDLAGLLQRSGGLSPRLALGLVAQIGAALAAAHGAGVVHGDLKPSQIFLPRRGPLPRFVKVLDFGLTPSGSLADPRDDQRALAAIFCQLIGGGAASLPSRQSGGVDARQHNALVRALQPRPQDRFASIEAFLEAMTVDSGRRQQAWRQTYAVSRAEPQPRTVALREDQLRVALVVALLALGSAAWALIVLG
jgi:serine/threonine protein kinase